MTEILNFTLHYDDRVTDMDDTSGDRGTTPGIGPVWFETCFPAGARIPVADYTSSRPAGIGPRVFDAYLDTDGRLKNKRGGTPGVRLWGNDPRFMATRFQYRVRAKLADALGRPVEFQPFYFDAPDHDMVRYLTDLMPRPGQSFGRGPATYLIDGWFNEDGELILENDDESLTSPITPADGSLFFVDNSNGSVSVGGS